MGMAFRWSKGLRPVQAIKRGIASLFVCAIVLLPLITFGMQVKAWMGVTTESRKAAPLIERHVRTIDKTTAPVNPFDEALISVTFDDGWETVYTQAMPLLQQNGIVTTQYVLSGTSNDQNYLSFSQIKAMQSAGHEIACHSVDHANLTKLNSEALAAELTDCKTVLQDKTGAIIKDFASPFGASNSTTIAEPG
jgi:peptidoglycan/xylan/chitin deacetylase (PgdA/CDA1 family)